MGGAVFRRLLLEMRERIRTRAYVVTVHAQEEMAEDDLSLFDLESCILSGEAVERQRDQRTGEWKYLVAGLSMDGVPIRVTVKMGPTGRVVFITVYAA